MSTVIQFLQAVSDFLSRIMAFDIIPGISMFTVLFYNLLFVVFISVITNRR